MANEQVRELLYQLENNIERAESDSWTVLCLDVRQGTNLRDMLRSAIADSDELAALRARIAGAAVGVLRDARGFDGDSISDDDLSAELVGQRVALLPVGEGEA